MKKPTRLIAGAVVAIGLIFPAVAEARPCAWQRTEFTVPAPHYNVEVFGIGGDYAVGTAITDGTRIIRWHNGQGAVLPLPFEDASVWPVGVSADGTVVAKLDDGRGFVTKLDDTHVFLGVAAGETAEPMAINGHGDVAGYVRSNGQARNVVWYGEDYSTYRLISTTNLGVAGIDDTDTVVTVNGVKYRTAGVGWPLQKPAGFSQVMVEEFDNGGAAGWAQSNGSYQALVWNPNGSIRYAISGSVAYSANSRGTVIGSTGSGNVRLWRDGRAVALPRPAPLHYATFVTEDDTLVGTYKDDNGDGYAAEWSCR